jgi:hypothetical protein
VNRLSNEVRVSAGVTAGIVTAGVAYAYVSIGWTPVLILGGSAVLAWCSGTIVTYDVQSHAQVFKKYSQMKLYSVCTKNGGSRQKWISKYFAISEEVGGRGGLEPPTPCLQTRFERLWNLVEFCCFEVLQHESLAEPR